ncbi:MAG: AmmeMemoRadiSam system protein B [Thermodesulfobacteriota bacterium]
MRTHCREQYATGLPVIFLALLLYSLLPSPAAAAGGIRTPAAAGSFYPRDSESLKQTVDSYLAKVPLTQVNGRIVGIMSPHAGYIFSGQVAAYAYREIMGKQYDTVIILGPSHRTYLQGASVGAWDAYETPLGRVPVNKDIAGKLFKQNHLFSFLKKAHVREHSIETQLPFLQRVLRDFDIVPILMGSSSLSGLKELSTILANVIKGKNVLLVASSDMSHYPAYRDAVKVDGKTLSLIEIFDPQQVFNAETQTLRKGVKNLATTLCGLSSVITVMLAAKDLGANTARALHYANSGDITHHGYQEKRKVVGYGAVAFSKQ